MNIPSLVSHTTLLNILLFFSSFFVAAFQISVPSTASLGTIPTATLTWDAGDPRIVSLSLVNGGDGTRTTIATLDVTEATVKSVPLPPLNVTGDFSVEALAPLTNGSSVTLAQSSISVFQSATSNSLTPGHADAVATTSTSDSSGDSQDSSPATPTTTSESSPQAIEAILSTTSTTTVQSTIVFTPSSASSHSSSLPNPLAFTSFDSTSADFPSSSKVFDGTTGSDPTAQPSNGSLTSSTNVPLIIGIVVATTVALLIVVLLVRWYFRHSSSRKASRQKRRQRKNAKRISPFAYDVLRPSSRIKHKSRERHNVEGNFDTEAFIGGHSRNNSKLDDEEQGYGYDPKVALERSGSILSLVSGKTCTTYTAETLADSDCTLNRVSLPTLRRDVVSTTSNFGSTNSQISEKSEKAAQSTSGTNSSGARNIPVEDDASEARDSIEPEGIRWLQEEMRGWGFDHRNHDSERFWAHESFQEPIPRERPPAYSRVLKMPVNTTY